MLGIDLSVQMDSAWCSVAKRDNQHETVTVTWNRHEIGGRATGGFPREPRCARLEPCLVPSFACKRSESIQRITDSMRRTVRPVTVSRDSLSATETTDFLYWAALSWERECDFEPLGVEGGSTLMWSGTVGGETTEAGRGTLTPVYAVPLTWD